MFSALTRNGAHRHSGRAENGPLLSFGRPHSRDGRVKQFIRGRHGKWPPERRALCLFHAACCPGFSRLGLKNVPLTVKEGRRFLQENGLNSAAGMAKDAALAASASCGAPKATPLGPLLKLENLEFAYDGRNPCLKGINLSFYTGQITAILGENGAGKTTLLKTIVGLLKPQRGKIFLHGRDITGVQPEKLADSIGDLSQNPNDYLFHDTVREELAYGLKIRGRSDPERLVKMMRLLEIEHLSETHPRDGASGERQRIALGTVMVTEPLILLLDEPTRGLDPLMKLRLTGLLRALQAEGKTIVVVTHDVEFAANVAERVVIIYDGVVVADGIGKPFLLTPFTMLAVNRLFRGMDEGVLTVEEASSKLQILQREVD